MTSSTPALSPPQWKAVISAFRRWPSPEWHQHYDTAAAITCSILRALSREPLRTGRILNINVPDLPLEQIKGIRVTRCGSRHPADQVIPQKDPRGNTLYWIGPPGEARCRAGYRFCGRG
jgi:5'-nucleotidase